VSISFFPKKEAENNISRQDKTLTLSIEESKEKGKKKKRPKKAENSAETRLSGALRKRRVQDNGKDKTGNAVRPSWSPITKEGKTVGRKSRIFS